MSGQPRIVAWRIVKRKLLRQAFSGEGARRFGGRWNSIGTSVVYTAGSLSLAMLEWRVHLAQWPPPDVAVIPVEFHPKLVWIAARLPHGWRRYPAPRSTAAFGDAWVGARRSAVLRVPSVVVPNEWNYVLNPRHPDFQKIWIGRSWLLKPDSRLGPIGSGHE